jgi:5-methylcytosine-specific restriction endonuclease McrA
LAERKCETCARTFEPDKRETRFCSRACIIRVRKPKALKPKVQRYCIRCSAPLGGSARLFCTKACGDAVREQRCKVNHPERACEQCGKLFKPKSKASRACSETCIKASKRWTKDHYRRARKHGVKRERFDPRVVFDRDGWRCQICLKMTRPTKRKGWQPLAPSLDHIVPLSKGGEHTMQNAQCAHRICNVLKSDSNQGQMRLLS